MTLAAKSINFVEISLSLVDFLYLAFEVRKQFRLMMEVFGQMKQKVYFFRLKV